MSRKLFAIAGMVIVLGGLLSACGPACTCPEVQVVTATPGGETVGAATALPAATEEVLPPGQLPRNKTLYLGGYQWGPPSTFNPLNGNPTWPVNGAQTPMVYVYETLLTYNVNTANLDPLLAKSISWTDALTAVITLQDGTKWQDGTPLTTDDVLFTFGLAKTHTDTTFSTFWTYVSEATATGDREITIKLNPDNPNPGMLLGLINIIRIIPKAIWEERAAAEGLISQFVDMNPVGSGPYKIQEATAERIVVVRDDNYWGQAVFGLPAPKYLVHPIFKSNDDGNLAFQDGQLDAMQQFTPQIWKMWEDKKLPVGTWFSDVPYYMPATPVSVYINTSKKGLDNPLVRRALAYSINYESIASLAMSSYSATVQSSLILPTGGEAQYFNADQVKSSGWKYDPLEAKRILEEDLQAKKGNDGVYVLPDGTRLGPYTIQCAYGWTDWMTAVNLISEGAKMAGIDVNTQFPDWPVLFPKMQQGDYDMILWMPPSASPNALWLRYRDILDGRNVPERGTPAFWNYGRFTGEGADALMDQAGATTDPATLKTLFDQLDKIFMDNVPVIPVMYRPSEFYEFNETVWTGFPTSDNPTAPPTFSQAGVEWLYLIKAK
jgi:peptide/nickel transport system substrate-binding protein